MTEKALEANQPSEAKQVTAHAGNGNGKVVAEQPLIDDLYSPDFLASVRPEMRLVASVGGFS